MPRCRSRVASRHSGDCALGLGVEGDPSEIVGPVEDVLPVDLRIPGCPPTPGAIASALIELIDGRAVFVSAPSRRPRRRTHVWFVGYTLVVLAVCAVSLATKQWSVAATAFLIALVFAWLTRWLWRRR